MEPLSAERKALNDVEERSFRRGREADSTVFHRFVQEEIEIVDKIQ